MLKQLHILFFSLIFVLPVFAEDMAPNEPQAYYDDRQHGWYWYENDELPEEKEYKLPDMETLWNMHPDEFSDLREEVTKMAVQNPTEENVLNYIMLVDISKKKSVAFSSVVALVGQKNPAYAGNESSYPNNAPGQRALREQREAEINQTIANSIDDFAIIMFTADGCGFCDSQSDILEYFNNMFGWPIRKVNINENPAMATKFQVEITPTLILVQRESGDFMPLSSGVISMSDLKSRVYRSIRHMKGGATPEQWFMHEYERDKGGDPLQHISAYQPGKVQ
jgi:conjugal transfer pilus assembly protein TraF